MSSIRSSTMEELDSVPEVLPGFRFYPSEEVLVGYYLKKKIEGKDSNFRHIIPEIDVCKHEPCDVPAFFEEPDFPDHEMEWFFFSQPDYKYTNSTRCNRATDQGFYKITGKVREIKARRSRAVIGKKRTLTFYEGRVPKAKKTNWIMHEYYLTNTELAQLGPNPNQQKDFILCRLKNKSANYKKVNDDLICDDLDDSGTGGCIAPNSEDDQAATTDMISEPLEHLASQEVGDVLNGNGAHDGYTKSNSQYYQAAANHMILEAEEHVLRSGNLNAGEPGGFVSSDFDDMIQELCAQLGEHLDSPSPPTPERPRPHQLPQLGKVPGTGDYLASNSDKQAADIHHMIIDEQELLAYKELERVLLGSGNPDDGEPRTCVSSDMLQEPLCAQLGEYMDSPFPPPGPPELGNALDVDTDECSSWPSLIEDNNSSLPNKSNIPTNYDSKPVSNTATNFENQTTDERSSRVYSQSDEKLQSFFRSIELDTLPSPISYLDLGDFLHANNYIGCTESQSAAPFPQSS